MGMSEKRLTELAAKAAGYQIEWVRNSGCHYRCEEAVGREQWCPLHDDAQALRLAADLCLSIDWFPGQHYVQVSRFGIGENIGWTDEADRAGAARRAITVVAAEIGRRLP